MKDTTVRMNVPLLIRLFELMREDVKTDADLHRVVENLLSVSDGRVLDMGDYDTIAQISRGGSLIRHRRSRQVVKFRK